MADKQSTPPPAGPDRQSLIVEQTRAQRWITTVLLALLLLVAFIALYLVQIE